ncbi:MAG: sulfatase-like hydrolase/transferase, partial [bacterium]|nr:sulfatase-like hydrolase/transferase [bacterium]
MKRLTRILAVLFLVAAIFFIYRLLNTGKPPDWQAVEMVERTVKKETGKNHLKKILFLNDIYRNYDSLLPFPNDTANTGIKKFTAPLSTVTVVKGKIKNRDGVLHLTGKEIVFTARNPVPLIKKHHLDFIELQLSTTRRVTVLVLLTSRGGGNTGKMLYGTTLEPGGKDPFKTITIPITPPLPEKVTDDGLLVIITAKGKRKPRVKVKGIHLLNRASRAVENMPRLDYFKYGAIDQRRVKSVFFRPGSTLTYTIQTPPPTNTNAGKRVVISGYWGSKGRKPLNIEVTINGKKQWAGEVSRKFAYFRQRVVPLQGKIQWAVTIKGPPDGLGVLGNVSFHWPFDAKERKNVVYYLIDTLRADKGGLGQPLMKKRFKDGAVFTSAYANATRTADSLPTAFSGKYKFMLVRNDGDVPRVPEDELLLAEYFKRKGYTTAAFINNPWLERANCSQGFDFLDLCWRPVHKASPFPSTGDYTKLKYGYMEYNLKDFVRRNKEKPLFIFIQTMEPHIPYEPPLAMRNHSAKANRKTLTLLFDTVTQSPHEPTLTNPTAEQLRVLKDLYKDQVLIANDFFNKVHDHLENEEVLNSRSLLLLTSDHGERFYEHGSWIHGPPDVY